MEPIELACGVALVLVLTGLAAFFGWRQWQTLALLKRDDPRMSADEISFLLGQVRRRTLCCILLALFAAQLAGWLLFMEGDFRQLRPGQNPVDDDVAKFWLWFYTGYWIFALMLLMAIVALAGVDFVATARYGLLRQRKLLKDQQAVLAQEAARLRLKRELD